MWNPFRRKPLLSEEDEFFQIETYRWLLTHYGGVSFYNKAELILPTQEYFPTIVSSPEEAARSTFAAVKKYAGLDDWPCTLVMQDDDPNLLVGETLSVQAAALNPHGTFSVNENHEVVITYNPKLVSSPSQMVATFAHELAHYLTCTAPEPPPGGWDNWEFATDIAATFLGFGIFQANSVFNFQQFSNGGTQGWSVKGGGYLTEAEHSFALAVFLQLKGISPDIAYPHCDRNIKAFLKSALQILAEKPYINTLREVKYIEPAL